MRMLHARTLVCFTSLASAAACGDNALVPTDTSPAPVEETAQRGGALGPIAFADRRLYLAVGPRVQIWDVAEPRHPRLLGTTAPVPAVINAIAVAGRRLYVGEHIDFEGRIHVFDVDDPAKPRHVTAFRTVEGDAPSQPLAFALDGGVLYVADHEQGLLKLDVNDVGAPILMASFPRGGLTDVRLTDDRVFATGVNFLGGGVTILDRDLRELGGVPGSELTAAAPASSTLLATSGTFAAQIVDIADPAAPVVRFEDERLRGFAVEASGTTVWYPMNNGVVTIDLADPDAPAIHVTLDEQLAGARRSVASAGVLAIGTDRGRLALLDVSAAQRPTFASGLPVTPCTNCIAVARADEHLFVVDSAAGLRAVRQGDLGLVTTTRRDALVVYEDIALAGHYAYVADWNYGLRIYDITDPERVVEASNLFTTGYPSAIALAGDRAVIGTSTDGGAIHVIDIRDPKVPRTLGSAETTKTRDVAVAGDLVYAGDEGVEGAAGGLRIFDIANPSKIELRAHFTGCHHVLGVAVRETIAALACDQQGLVLLDVTSASAPVMLGALDLVRETDAATAIAIDGERAYLGTGRGVDVIDISDPRRPRRVTTLPTAWQVRGITVSEPGHVLAAAGGAGLYQWRLP